MLDTVDPFLALYAFEKSKDPDKRLVWVQYQADVIRDVDRILELAHGTRETVKSQQDWEVVEALFRFFVVRWPKEFADFKASVDLIRHTRNPGGKSLSREIMYVGAMPPRLERMIRVIFPHQKFDKTFIYKLVKKFKLLKVYNENN